MTDKEILIDGVNVAGCERFTTEQPHLGITRLNSLALSPKCEDNPNCYYKQLQRRGQELKHLQEDYAELEQRHNESYQEFIRLKQEYEELKVNAKDTYELYKALQESFEILLKENEKLKEKLYQIEDIVRPINNELPEDNVLREIMLILNDCNGLTPSRYKQALDKIEEIAKRGLTPICYKSNCNRCQCYEGDDSKISLVTLINNYFTEDGFKDDNGDFYETLEGLVENERAMCNKAKPLSDEILSIINELK